MRCFYVVHRGACEEEIQVIVTVFWDKQEMRACTDGSSVGVDIET